MGEAASPPASTLPDESAFVAALVGRHVDADVLRLTRDREAEALRRVLLDFYDAAEPNGRFRANHQEFFKVWRGITDKKSFPFEGAANIHVPFTSSAIEQTKARLLKGLLGDPGNAPGYFTDIGENVDPATLEAVNQWFTWELDNVVGLREAVSVILHYVCVDGFGLPMPYYNHVERDVRWVREFDYSDALPLSSQVLTIVLEQLFPGEETELLSTLDAGVYKIRHRAGAGAWFEAEVTCSADDMRIYVAVETTEVTFDGVCIDNPELENVVLINSASEVERLPFFGYRSWLTPNEYRAGVESGTYRKLPKDEVEAICNSATTKQQEMVPMDMTRLLDAIEGANSTDPAATSSESMQHRSWLEVYRWEGDLPWGKRGTDIGVAVWVIPRARRIIRCVRLDELNRRGEKTPIKFSYIEQPGRFYPVGLAEWLRHVQAELDAIHNQRLDAGLITTVPFFFYTPMAGLAATDIRVAPGRGFPIKDPKSVIFPQWNWSAQWSFQEEGLVKRYAQEQAGLSEPALGSFVTKRQSAAEYLGTTSSLEVRTDFVLEGLARSLHKLLYRIFELYQQHMPDGRVYQISTLAGETLVERMSRTRIQSKMMLTLTANSQQIAAQLQRDIATNMLALLINPFLVQMGVTQPDTVYAAVEKVVKASGYKGVPIHKPNTPDMSQPPDVEHRRMLMGEQVMPSPLENFDQHLAVHMQLASRPDVGQLMPPDALTALGAHIGATKRMQETVMAMQAMQAQMAAQMQASMGEMGIRPIGAGSSSPGGQAGAGKEEEGVVGGQSQQENAA